MNSFVPEFKTALYSRRFNNININQAKAQDALAQTVCFTNASNGGIITGLTPHI
jgi:hypothetical protein